MNQIPALPTSLKTLGLFIEYHTIRNHNIDPPNFLINNTDAFSRALHLASHNLTTLTVRLFCITSDLLWPNGTNTPAPNWPNLRILDISTAFDRPTGTWWFISEAARGWETPERASKPPIPEWEGEDAELYLAAGEYPDNDFRTAPDPALFDDLALRLARAVSRMPVLMYLDFEFHSWRQKSWNARQQDKGFEGYKGWGASKGCRQ
jgi:hypothetical protein